MLYSIDVANQIEIDILLERKTLKGTKRILGWCMRFISNCKAKGSRDKKKWGPLTTEEIENADEKLIRNIQQSINLESKEAQELGLSLCDDKVIRCFGRLPDHQPIFIPKQSLYAVRVGEEVHRQVGHKGVNMMMAKIREKFWIPTLRAILKKIKGRCESCKVMAAKPFPAPTAGQLPQSRVTADYPFGVIGVDFVGPFQLKGGEEKAYVINFSCGTSRAVYFTTTRNLGTSNFIDRLNEFIAARTRPRKIISDNAQTFKAASEFINKLRKSEELHDYLSDQGIIWEFILAKSPWRGSFYERLHRDLKNILYQKLRRSHLTYEGLSRVIKDIKIIFNNRPLQYVEDEMDIRVLTPNRIIHGRDIYQLEEIEEPDSLNKMEKRIRKAKQEMWNRWTTEYVRALREKHDVTKVKPYHPDIGEIVLVVGDSKNKHEWKHGLIVELLKGKDKVVRGMKMIVNNNLWERPVQLICPLEIKSTLTPEELNRRIQSTRKREDVNDVSERPKRMAKQRGMARTKKILESD